MGYTYDQYGRDILPLPLFLCYFYYLHIRAGFIEFHLGTIKVHLQFYLVFVSVVCFIKRGRGLRRGRFSLFFSLAILC